MNSFKKILLGSLLAIGSQTVYSYPHFYCEGNSRGIKQQSNNLRFTINESQFSSTEIARLTNAVQSWGKTRIGETPLNVNTVASEVLEVTVANSACEVIADATGAPSGSVLWASTLDLCLGEAFDGITDYSIIWRTGFIDQDILVHAPPINFAPVGWVFFSIQTPPGFPSNLDATDYCLHHINQYDGVGHDQPYFSKGRHVQLARPAISSIYGHPGAGIGSVHQGLLYDDFTRSTPRDINMITVHEIGHVLGLRHPSTGSIINSVMRADYSELANYRYTGTGARTALPEPIDAKNIRNLYPATAGTLVAAGVNQWEWTPSLTTSWKVRPQSAYTSFDFVDGTLTGEVESWPHSPFQTFAVPISLYNKGTTNNWVSGWTRFSKTDSTAAAPAKFFGAQLPPRSTVRLVRWVQKPSSFNNTPPGEYRLDTNLTNQAPINLNPLDFIHFDRSVKTFEFN